MEAIISGTPPSVDDLIKSVERPSVVVATVLLMVLIGCVQDEGAAERPADPSPTMYNASVSPAGASPRAVDPISNATGGGESVFIAKVDDVPPGSRHFFTMDGREVILANFDGTFIAFYAQCPVHELYNIELEGNGFFCPHGTFDHNGIGDSGEPLVFGAVLESIPVRVGGGMVYGG